MEAVPFDSAPIATMKLLLSLFLVCGVAAQFAPYPYHCDGTALVDLDHNIIDPHSPQCGAGFIPHVPVVVHHHPPATSLGTGTNAGQGAGRESGAGSGAGAGAGSGAGDGGGAGAGAGAGSGSHIH